MGRIKSLPKYDQLTLWHFTGHYSRVPNLIGGMVKHNLEDSKQLEYKDTCVIRISRCLNLSNQPITKKAGIRMNSGDNKKGMKGKLWYIYSVVDMKKYLELTYGAPDVVLREKRGSFTKEKLKGQQKGIILFTGHHVDLWDGTNCNYHDDSFAKATEILIWATPDVAPKKEETGIKK